jgi:hypothetical protein
MENFRFTLFNTLTLLVMALTVAMAVVRARTRPEAAWPSLYYAAVAAYALAFRYSLNLWLLAAGILAAALLRFAPRVRPYARVAEFAVLAYVFIRSAALLMMW